MIHAWLGYYSRESLVRWIIITLVARFPHIFIYTFGGEKLLSNPYGVIIAGAAIAAVVYLFAVVYLKRKRRKNTGEKQG